MHIQALILLFPLVFMLHDFEELLFMAGWVERHRTQLSQKRLGKFVLQHGDLSTAAFGIAIACMFLLVSAVSVFAALYGWYNLFAGLLIAYSLHVLLHLGQSLMLGSYVPAGISGLLTFVYSLPMLRHLLNLGLLDARLTALFSLLGVALLVPLLPLLLRLGKRLDARFNPPRA